MADKESPSLGSDSIDLFEEIRLLVDMVIERSGPWVEAVFASGHEGIHRCAHSSGVPFSAGASSARASPQQKARATSRAVSSLVMGQ